jgi:hypothetical protein
MSAGFAIVPGPNTFGRFSPPLPFAMWGHRRDRPHP